MTSIEPLLRAIGPDIESQVKADLKGPLRLVYQFHLPIVWAFKTESETVTLIVDINGNVVVFPGCDEDCDVLIEWNHEHLASLLAARSRQGLPEESTPVVSIDTTRGRDSFNYLRGQLGL